MNSQDEAESKREFWARYAHKLLLHKIVEKEAAWIIRRAEEFVDGLNGVRLRQVSSTYVGEYLDVLGRRADLRGWQVAQAVFALKILFLEMVELEWATDFDWNDRIAGCRELEADHPTIARDRPVCEMRNAKLVMRNEKDGKSGKRRMGAGERGAG